MKKVFSCQFAFYTQSSSLHAVAIITGFENILPTDALLPHYIRVILESALDVGSTSSHFGRSGHSGAFLELSLWRTVKVSSLQRHATTNADFGYGAVIVLFPLPSASITVNRVIQANRSESLYSWITLRLSCLWLALNDGIGDTIQF